MKKLEKEKKKESEEEYASSVKDGVEVIDIKAIEKDGIPSKNRKNWDKLS